MLYEKSKHYTKETLDDSVNKIKSSNGNMGGTNLLSPMKAIIEAKLINVELPRHVFVLTDGEIENSKETCKLISEFSHQTRVHTFGFGSGVDKYLVKEMAKNGKGKYYILEDTSASNVKTKVIEALKFATKPALTNLKTKWSSNVQLENP